MIVKGEQLQFTIGAKTLIDNVGVNIEAGSFTAIIGPNGAGKTTLLKLIDGDYQPTAGVVHFDGQPLASIDRLSLARRRAVLPQIGSVPFAIKVTDIVALGRAPYRYHRAQQYDRAVIDACLAAVDIQHLMHHDYATLSGGEQHRVHIARTLAQIQATPDANLQGQVLFLDEPTNHLDVLHQYRLMQQLKALQEKGLTVVTVMHDLSLTLQFAEQIILLHQGKKMGSYTPRCLVESGDLSTAYQMDMQVRWDDAWQRFLIAPML